MYRLSISVALALVVVGVVIATDVTAQDASPAATSPEACPTTTEEENALLVARWAQQTHLGGTPTPAEDLLAEDLVVHRPAGIGPDLAGDEARAYLSDQAARRQAGMPDFAVSVDDVLVDGDNVIVRWTGVGHQTGPLRGIPATNNQAVITAIEIFRVECGQIAEIWYETDFLGELRQLGGITDDELETVGTPTLVVATPAP